MARRDDEGAKQLRELEDQSRVLCDRFQRVAIALGLTQEVLADLMERAAESSRDCADRQRLWDQAEKARRTAKLCREVTARMRDTAASGVRERGCAQQ